MIHPKINPIILREIRSRMRRRQTFFGLTGYVVGLGALVWSFYAIFYYSNVIYNYNNLPASNAQYGSEIGKVIFISITLLMLMIFPFNAVAFVSDAIAGERERQTYEILRITTMSTFQLVSGKLGAVFIFLVLYLLLALPIQALSFLFGGVTMGEVFIATIAVLVTGLTFAALGIYISSLARTAKMATAISTSLIILFVYVVPIIIWLLILLAPPFISDLLSGRTWLSLLLVVYGGGLLASLNPLGAAILTSVAAADGKGYFLFTITDTIQSGPVTLWVISPWLVYVFSYSLLALLFVFLTTKRLSKLSVM